MFRSLCWGNYRGQRILAPGPDFSPEMKAKITLPEGHPRPCIFRRKSTVITRWCVVIKNGVFRLKNTLFFVEKNIV
jgi:hypothetical protein